MITLFEDRECSLIKKSHHFHFCDFIILGGPVSIRQPNNGHTSH